ncbi:hypothetical protein LCGC14_0436660 [marine sediment metagenome]|uniref:Uncharacterized protein n=1 Tax=marine sediment metagenome TaxID=412755 RepID=A0A0F9T4R2_9ZZZZ
MPSPVFTVVECPFTEAAGVDEVKSRVVTVPGTHRVVKVFVVDNDGITLDASDFTVLSVETAAAVEIATFSTVATTLVAKTPVDVALTGTPIALEFDQGDSIVFLKTDTGATGVAVEGSIAVLLEQVR